MLELLLIPSVLWSLGCFFLPLYAAWNLWGVYRYNDKPMAIVILLLGWPLGMLFACAPWAMWEDSKDTQLHLNKTEWVCMDSHVVPITTYVKSGNVMVPITNYHRVCDEYRRK